MVEIKELMSTVDSLCEEAGNAAKDTSKLIAGWQRVDKPAMEQIVQSLYHMSWNLKDLSEAGREVTGCFPVFGPSKIEDIRYADHETLNRIILIERTKGWHKHCISLHSVTQRMLSVLDGFDARPWHMGFINSRISLDLMFFESQFLRATGKRIED